MSHKFGLRLYEDRLSYLTIGHYYWWYDQHDMDTPILHESHEKKPTGDLVDG
jgi:hypothetical protein